MSLNTLPSELLSAYLDGELSAADRETVERALAADPGLRRKSEALQTLAAALRESVEARADQADFTGLADRVLAEVRPVSRRTSRAERPVAPWRLPWLPVGAGARLAAAADAVFALRTPQAVVPPGVVVKSASADDQAQLQPVVKMTESGDAIIWLVEHPDASGTSRSPALEPDRPAAQTPLPSQERPRAGEL